jgi:flagellar biosynthesis component FlhA
MVYSLYKYRQPLGIKFFRGLLQYFGRNKMGKNSKRTFSDKIVDYYNLTEYKADENLNFIFSNEKKPDLILSSRDETVVALQYDEEKMQSPTIRTKGKNEFAKQILEFAKNNKIPIVKDDELTRELYVKVSRDTLLPEAFYESIAKLYSKYNDILESEGNDANNNTITNIKNNGKDMTDDIRPHIPDKISLEIGTGLIPLVKYPHSPLNEKIQNMRRRFLTEMGFKIPPVKTTENPNLGENEYCIKVNGDMVECSRINMYRSRNKGNSPEKLAGEETGGSAFDLMALWIYKNETEKAQKAGFGVYDPVTVIVAHIFKICKKFSRELVGLDEIQEFIDCVKEKYPVVVNDMLKYYSLVDIKKVVHGLLAESVSIKNIVIIFEALSEYGDKFSHNHDFLIEKVRQRLGWQICSQYMDKENTLRVLVIEPDMENKITKCDIETTNGMVSCLNITDHEQWIKELSKNIDKMEQAGFPALVLCSEAARRMVKDSTKREFPDLVVLSVPEIPDDIIVESMGIINPAGE